MNDPFILSAISAASTPAVTAWPIPGGAGVASSPLTSAAISSITGSRLAGSPITIYSSWVGGTAPFKVQYSIGGTFTGGTGNSHSIVAFVVAGVTGNSHSVDTFVVAGVDTYTVTVTDALGVVKVSAEYSFPSLYISAATASYSFNTATKTATFSASVSGNPPPFIEWYVSTDGAYWASVSSESSWDVVEPETTVYAYYIASNSAGSVTSNTTGG